MPAIISEKLTAKHRPKDAFINAAEIFIKFFSVEIVVLLLILFVAGIWFISAAYSENISGFGAQVREKQNQLENENQKLSVLKGFKAGYENLAASEQKVLKILPLNKEEAEIFVQIESMASKNNISVASIDMATGGEKENKEKLKKITVNVSAETGDYVALKKFLSALEKNLRLLDVKSINFEPNGKTFNLILNGYYYVE